MSIFKQFQFSKEILLVLIPFLFGFAVNSYSTGFDYHQKAQQVTITSTKELQNRTIGLKIETHLLKESNRILSDQIKTLPKLRTIANKLAQKKLLTNSDYEFLNRNAYLVSENLGKIQAYRNFKFSVDSNSSVLINVLERELELTEYFLKNEWNHKAYNSFNQAHSTMFQFLKISNILDTERNLINDSDELTNDSIRSQYELLGHLNHAIGGMMLALCLLLIIYGFQYRKFAESKF